MTETTDPLRAMIATATDVYYYGDAGTEREWRQCRFCLAYAEGEVGSKPTPRHGEPCPVGDLEHICDDTSNEYHERTHAPLALLAASAPPQLDEERLREAVATLTERRAAERLRPSEGFLVACLVAERARLVAERAELREQLAAASAPPLSEWICEQHPELDWPHDDCAGPGMPKSAQVTALIYQRDQARLEHQETRGTVAALKQKLREQASPAFPPSICQGDCVIRAETCRADCTGKSVSNKWARKFHEHTKAVGDFLNELYAIMVDPLAEGSMTVAEMKDAILKAAIRDRDAEQQASPASPPRACDWLMETTPDGGEYWETKCGHAYQFTEGGPRENSMAFCCYCGLSLTAKPLPTPPAQQEEK